MGQSSSTQRDQRSSHPPHLSVPPAESGGSSRHDEIMEDRVAAWTRLLHTQAVRRRDEARSSQATNTGQDASHSTPPSSELPPARNLRSMREHGINREPVHREHRPTTFARIAARRQSTMSRLGSRILPNSVIRGLLSSEEETPAEGHAHRHGVISRSFSRSDNNHGSGRLSPFSRSSSGITRRRSAQRPVFLPRSESALPSSASNAPRTDAAIEQAYESVGGRHRSARLHRVRNSLSSPISSLFGAPPSTSNDTASAAYQPLRSTADGHDGIDPQSETAPDVQRVRSAPGVPQTDLSPMSRILQLAAAAIAAQLSGTDGPPIPNAQAVGEPGLGGTLENFIRTVQRAAAARNAANHGTAPDAGNTPNSPVNFLRVFRFPNSDLNESGTEGADPSNPGAPADGMDLDGPGEGTNGRTFSLVVVGVRSVPPGSGDDQQTDDGQGLDGLLRVPFLTANIGQTREDGARPEGPPGIQPRQAAAGRDAASESRFNIPSRRASDFGTRVASSLPTVLSESPPGPHPPPSTPAEQGLSGASTPNRRPSSASALPIHPLPQLHEDQLLQPTVETLEDSTTWRTTRQRRRSDTEYARHRNLGSGAARRNGVVEPDGGTPTGRNWLIYIVGTNLSEDHPALATPSLFTDVSMPDVQTLKLTLLEPDLRRHDSALVSPRTGEATCC